VLGFNQDDPSRNSVKDLLTPATELTVRAQRGRPRSDRVQRAILDAARELLIQDGYTRLRLEHIAARAGVGKATLYRRWRSKEALAQALISDLAAPHLTIEITGDTRKEMLAAVLNPLTAITDTNFGPVIRALMSQIAGNPALGDQFRATIVASWRTEVEHLIARGIERGDLCPDADAGVATELLLAPVYFRLVFGGVLDRDFAERIVGTIMEGYATR
jgi:AcrR family transcriptional regulator